VSGGGGVPAERLELLESVLDALEDRGLPRAEVYAKRGRSRVIEKTPGGTTVSYHREEGWAARAGDDRRSLFATATGAPGPGGPGGGWPEADGEALELPGPDALLAGAAGDPEGGDAWREAPELDAPLIGEREAVGLLATLGEELAAELPGTRILRARLSDGASEWEIGSRLDGEPGVAGAARGRVALLRVEAAYPGGSGGPGGPGGGAARAALEVAAREAVAFEPRALARRMADRLSVAARGSAPERDRAVALLAPAVGARLLAGLVPLFFGEAGEELAAGLLGRDGRFASDAVSVVDDGRLPGGLLAAPVDGEGLTTAAATLVRSGDRRPPLVEPARMGGRAGGRPRGRIGRRWACMRRPGWRDLPAPGPSHLFLSPSGELGVGEMLREVARGYYLIDVDGAVRIDLAGDRISIPVVGFRVERGAAASPLAGAVIEGGLGPFLRRIDAAARDLTFFTWPGGAGGMIGAPTLRVEGVELVRR
jgi:predicted Zn-dependent protease